MANQLKITSRNQLVAHIIREMVETSKKTSSMENVLKRHTLVNKLQANLMVAVFEFNRTTQNDESIFDSEEASLFNEAIASICNQLRNKTSIDRIKKIGTDEPDSPRVKIFDAFKAGIAHYKPSGIVEDVNNLIAFKFNERYHHKIVIVNAPGFDSTSYQTWFKRGLGEKIISGFKNAAKYIFYPTYRTYSDLAKKRILTGVIPNFVSIAAGTAGGVIGGSIAGAMLGSIVPGIGTALGALIGMVVGAALGSTILADITALGIKHAHRTYNKNQYGVTSDKYVIDVENNPSNNLVYRPDQHDSLQTTAFLLQAIKNHPETSDACRIECKGIIKQLKEQTNAPQKDSRPEAKGPEILEGGKLIQDAPAQVKSLKLTPEASAFLFDITQGAHLVKNINLIGMQNYSSSLDEISAEPYIQFSGPVLAN